jgi:large subunit ribosomal protein L5
VPRLKERYEQELRAQLKDDLGFKSVMRVPRVSKITLNMGVGEAKTESKALDSAIEELTTIAGQRAQVRLARKSIASFKLREGMPIGARVTLRGNKMWEFLDRLVSIALPRIRDFRGLAPESFDGRGNYSIGIREQIIFPEIDYDSIDQVRGLDVTITTSAPTDEEAFALLEAFGMPFSRDGRPGGPSAQEAEDEEEERRREEARARAEAEQAALEQLKEENPEAYAKPEPKPEEGEEGEAPAAEGDAPPEDDKPES